MGNERMLVVYWRGLHALHRYSAALVALGPHSGSRNAASGAVAGVRHFSSTPPSGGQGDNPVSKKTGAALQEDLNKAAAETAALVQPPHLPNAESGLSWLNIKASILGTQDSRVVLPGAVGLSLSRQSLRNQKQQHKTVVLSALPPIVSPEELFRDINRNCKPTLQVMSDMDASGDLASGADMAEDLLLECKVQDCPNLIMKDLKRLFPSYQEPKFEVTAVTLSQRTTHDMATWSEAVEEEREELLKHFVNAASQICKTLTDEGYWADFVDPSSGRPFYDDLTTDTMFETDDRYRYLGLTIEDLGCCKVISHKLFGTHVFVGVIFTDAPMESEVLREALALQKAIVGKQK
uniref:Methylmalonic aciduria and homocystinuria type D n=1 Tax=Hirondellea gigas TaxID=1518452 RepID=A0A6A7FTY8_9CRUS